MTQPGKEDRRLVRLTKICLALPEATREIQGAHAGFLVRKKTFAYFLNDHHGDGRVAVTCKVLPGENTALIAAQPKGWVALRLDAGEVDWKEVAELAACSYRLVAPKRLTARLKVAP